MSSPLRVLLVARATPPSAEVGGNRVASFCKFLPEFGIEPVVLTVQDRFHKRLDGSLSIPATTRVVRTAQYSTPLDWYARWKSRLTQKDSRNSLGNDKAPGTEKIYTAPTRGIRQHLLSLLSIPDYDWGWYLPATRMGRRLLQSEQFDAILSTSPPHTDHLIGLRLKNKCKIPWIADFRDPWVNDDSPLFSQPKWRRSLEVKIEASCVKAADLVVCNTDWLCGVMRDRYRRVCANKFVTLTNGFDDLKAPPDKELHKHKPLRCLHLGGIYGGRRIDTFCASLSILLESQRLDRDAVKILFLGDTDELEIAACRRVAGSLMDSGMIEFHQRVDKVVANRFLWDADLLLIFQGRHRAQVPLKFYEYLSTGKPIFAVSQEGALSELMAQTGIGISVRENDPYEIGEKFLYALALPTQPAEVVQRRWAGQFHFRSLSGQLAQWIRELVDGQ